LLLLKLQNLSTERTIKTGFRFENRLVSEKWRAERETAIRGSNTIFQTQPVSINHGDAVIVPFSGAGAGAGGRLFTGKESLAAEVSNRKTKARVLPFGEPAPVT
jgi:hypothetical protein